MGVRLREFMERRRRGRGPSVGPRTVEGWTEFERKLDKLGDFPKDMYKELRRENHRIGRVGARVIKRALPQQGTEFIVYEKRRKGIERDGNARIYREIPKNTLKRSIRTWNSKYSKINVQLGPRGGRGAISYDGYYAGIVDSGHVGGEGESRGSKFFNKLQPALKKLEPKLRRIQLVAYRRVYYKWIAKLK